jgi:hypothetical protein
MLAMKPCARVGNLKEAVYLSIPTVYSERRGSIRTGLWEAGSCRVARERTAITPNNRRLHSPAESPQRPGANRGIHLTGSTVAGYGVEWAVVGGVLWKVSSRRACGEIRPGVH